MDEQNNPWLTISSTKDIRTFLDLSRLVQSFLSLYDQLGEQFSVTITEATDGDDEQQIPVSGSLNYNGMTVAVFDLESSPDAGENRFLSVGIIDSNIYFSRVFAPGRSCIEYFSERLNTVQSVSRYCSDAIGLMSMIVSKWPNQVLGALQIDMLKDSPSIVSVTAQFSFDPDADADDVCADVSLIQRFINPYRSQIINESDSDQQADESMPTIQVIVHTNPDRLSQAQRDMISLIRETAADLDHQRQAYSATEQQLLPASCGQYYDGSAVNVHVISAFTRTLKAESNKLMSVIRQLPDKYHAAAIGGQTQLNRAYEQPFDINVMLPQADSDADDDATQNLVSVHLDDHQLNSWRHFSRFATLTQTQQLAQQPAELQQWAHQLPAALISSAAIDLILDRIGAIKVQLEEVHDQLGLTVIPKIEYDPLNRPSDYAVSALIVPSKLSAADYDKLDDSQILGAMHFRRRISNAELTADDLTAERLGTKMTALELSSRSNFSQSQLNTLINLYMLAIDSFDGTGLIDMPSADDVHDSSRIDVSQMGTASIDQVAKQIHDQMNRNNDDQHDAGGDAADDQDE